MQDSFLTQVGDKGGIAARDVALVAKGYSDRGLPTVASTYLSLVRDFVAIVGNSTPC